MNVLLRMGGWEKVGYINMAAVRSGKVDIHFEPPMPLYPCTRPPHRSEGIAEGFTFWATGEFKNGLPVFAYDP